MDNEIPKRVESKMDYHIAHGVAVKDHPVLRNFARYADRIGVTLDPGVRVSPRWFADVIYVDSGIGKARIGKDVVDIMSGTMILVKPGIPYEIIPGDQELTARIYKVQ